MCSAISISDSGSDEDRDNDGDYPLTWAVYWGRADCLQIILSVPEPHLDLTVTDRVGRNIAQTAIESENTDRIFGKLFGSTAEKRQRCLELLSGDRRMDRYWNTKDRNGDTPLMYCLKNNKIEMARCLINTPVVDLDTVDSEGRYLEDIARSVFNSFKQSNSVSIFISERGT